MAPATDPTTQIIADESTDGGKDWSSSFLTAATASSGDELDKPWIACDQTGGNYANSVYAAWTLETNATDPSSETFQIYFSYCRPGSTFQTPIPIGSQVTNPEDVLGADIVVGKNGSVYVFWGEEVGNNQVDIMMAKSTDGGQSFPTVTNIFSGTSISDDYGNTFSTTSGLFEYAHTWPVVAVNPANGTLNLVYGGGSQIYFSTSTDGGSSWSTPAEEPIDDGYSQVWSPTIACNRNGNLAIGYYAGNPGSAQAEVLTATSTNGGSNFTVESAGSTLFNPIGDHLSDYIGIAYNDHTYWTVWPQESGTNI